jgi:uroporphyrin-III C-methyltransferase
LAQGAKNIFSAADENPQPLASPNADTLVYYMGRKDAKKIAEQLISKYNSNHPKDTPIHILEAVSTKNERHWCSTLGELAEGKADDWFDRASPALIMIGKAFRERSQTLDQTVGHDAELESSGTIIDDGLQDSLILTNRRRSA